jgi:hypothetical protein
MDGLAKTRRKAYFDARPLPLRWDNYTKIFNLKQAF